MKAFRYRLEKILKIKKHREREWELKLAEANGQCLTIENQIHNLARRRINTFSSLHQMSAVTLHDLTTRELYLQKIEQDIRKMETILLEKKKAREKIQSGYIEAHKERQVLDKLKDKKASEYYKEARIAEVNEIDDSNIQRFLFS